MLSCIAGVSTWLLAQTSLPVLLRNKAAIGRSFLGTRPPQRVYPEQTSYKKSERYYLGQMMDIVLDEFHRINNAQVAVNTR